MPGCPNGADPTPGAVGLQELLQKVSFTATVATLLRNHSPTAWAGFTASLVDVNALCALNPDPPEALSAQDFASALGYIALPGVATEALLERYMFEWLRYQAFLQFCVCRPVTPDPAQNCVHSGPVSVAPPGNSVDVIGSCHIEDAVWNSWVFNTDGSGRFLINVGRTVTGAAAGAHAWDVQFQNTSGTWVSFTDNRQIPVNAHADVLIDASAASLGLPRTPTLRILNVGASTESIANLDVCFVPFVQVAPPLPDQPDIPTLPVVPAPVCDTTDLCSIVSELARQMTRMAAQLSDVQAAVTATDQFATIASHPISGEGELVVALGTRAVSVELTQLGPEAFTSALGRPRGLMRVGSVRWGDGIGYSAREFIDGDRFDRLRPQGALTLSFQLLAGTTGTLRWLG